MSAHDQYVCFWTLLKGLLLLSCITQPKPKHHFFFSLLDNKELPVWMSLDVAFLMLQTRSLTYWLPYLFSLNSVKLANLALKAIVALFPPSLTRSNPWPAPAVGWGPKGTRPRGGQERGQRSTEKRSLRGREFRQTDRWIDGRDEATTLFFLSDGHSLNQRKIGVDPFSGFQRFSAKPTHGGLLDGARWFTLPICCYCRSRFVCLQTQLCSFPQQQPMRTETHTSRGIQNVMILDDLHYSLRSLENVCLCLCGWGVVDCGGNRGQENHIHMVKQLHRAPFSESFYPQ